MIEMDKAMLAYKKGECSAHDAINIILTEIYNNKAYFRLDKLDEDNFSDYLIYLQERLPRFLDLYNPEISKFSTYIRKICMTQLRSWYRKHYRAYARDMALTTYALEEGLSNMTAEDAEEVYADSTSPEESEYKTFLEQTNHKIPIQTKIMMLALKSASFLTSSHITKICRLAEISEDELYEKLDIINNKLDAKLERQRHMLQLQNEAYIIKKESDIQMSFLNPDSSHFRTAEISRNFHDQLWKRRMEKTRTTHDVYPTNTLVSEVLDVPLGQVTHVFSAVRHKMGGSNTQKEVSYGYDTLRSDRKRPQTERTGGDPENPPDKDSKR